LAAGLRLDLLGVYGAPPDSIAGLRGLREGVWEGSGGKGVEAMERGGEG